MVTINGVEIGLDCFPNNERIFKTDDITGSLGFTIEMKYEYDIDITKLIMAKRFLDDKYNNPRVYLKMLYIPYSRMDREIEGYMFSLKYFCKIINELNFHSVLVLDAHSNVSTALLDRCKEINPSKFINNILSYFKTNDIILDYVFYPDNGACKRYTETLNLHEYIPYFYGNKKRNLQTGEIIEYELVNTPDIQDRNILIIDDLCAGGRTFYEAAEKLKENGANNIYLYVSHCENSIYNGKLLKSGLLSQIFTTDSLLRNWESSLIKNAERL